MTGYPSIDKPWLKYYTNDQINAELPECKIYEYLYERNKDYQNKIALNYYDRKITYGQLFSGIEKAAKAFTAIGVEKEDVVSVIAVTIPETIYTLYALNRIGAIANMIDPRTSVEGIKDYLIEVKSKVIVVLDVACEKAAKAIKGTAVRQIIVISPADSLPSVKKQLYKLTKRKRLSKDDYSFNWSRFLSLGEGIDKVSDTPYAKDNCCIIVHTGGTTGIPKGVMLSDDNLNCSAFQGFNTALDFQRQHSWANIMPPFIAYGVGNGLHLPLIIGMEVILIPAFDPSKYDELLLKYHPSHIVGVPSHYENVMNSPRMVNHDLTYLISPIVGGDNMRTDLEKNVDKFISSHHGRNKLIKGYGMTEVSAAVSVCISNECNKIGGVGIPFAHTIISVFDTETGEELKYGQKGEVCMTGPNTMIGYYNNPEETERILRKHKDGNIWVHSGDLGYMDEDGQLFIDGRLKRMIVRYDGFKVFPSQIEKVILDDQSIRAACVVGVPDDEHAQGKLPVAFIVINDPTQKEISIAKAKMLCREELPEYAQPIRITVIKEMPLTPIGKVDYRALELLAKEGEVDE